MPEITYTVILLSIAVLLAVVPEGHAVSPLAQFESGVPLVEIACSDGKVLLESPRGTPACVRESSVEGLEQRGFALIQITEPAVQDTAGHDAVSDSIDYDADFDPIIMDIPSGNNKFTVDFYKQISDNDDNVFFSPTSIYIAFSLLYEGAKYNTAEQMQGTFGFDPDQDARHESVSGFLESLDGEDRGFELNMANAIWLSKWFVPRAEYEDVARDTYLADIESIDLPIDGKAIIDGWAAEQTNGKITEIVEPENLAFPAATVIANAIYFKGTWIAQFPAEETAPMEFWKNFAQSVETDFMNVEGIFDYAALNGSAALRMPYEGDRLSMLVILPDEIEGIELLDESISAKMIERWNEAVQPTDVIVSMPKFQMNTNYDLIPPLQNLGIRNAFLPNVADFSGIVGPPGAISVSFAAQKAFVDVNEEGTEAAAVTVVGSIVSLPPPIPKFTADHPFIFVIQDDETGTILFMGRVSDPSI